MRPWQTSLTLLGWGAVLAVFGANGDTRSLPAMIVILVWAISTIALLRIPRFRGRDMAIAVSWLGPLLVLLSGLFPILTAPATFSIGNAAVQVLISLSGFTWLFTLGVLPVFASLKLIRPSLRCPVFDGTEMIPWHYWWAPVLMMQFFLLARLWLAWSIATEVGHLLSR